MDLLQAGQNLRRHAGLRPRHRGLWRGDPAVSGKCVRLHRPRQRIWRQRRHRPRDRRFHRGDPARPQNAFAHMRRGFIHHLKGENGRAVAHLSEAIRLKPDNSGAHFYRGITYLYDNSLADAVADFNRANELDPKRPYGVLWHDIAARRHAAPSRLSEAALHLDMGKWPAPVILLFLDQTTPDSAIAAADDPDPMTKQDQLCEAHFYSGVHALRRDAKAEAVRLLRIAAQDCPKKLIEGHAAQLELKMLGATP